MKASVGHHRNSPLSDLGGYWRARLITLVVLISASVPLWSDVVIAGEPAKPTGKILLRITGGIDKTDTVDAAHFDPAMLQGLPVERSVTLGPLRIMLSFDDHPELLNQSNMTMSVWQLTGMHVH